MNAPKVVRFPYTRFGLGADPVGEYVALDYHGRKLLGEVVSIQHGVVSGSITASVRHFNGEQWPIEPCVAVLEWIRQ